MMKKIFAVVFAMVLIQWSFQISYGQRLTIKIGEDIDLNSLKHSFANPPLKYRMLQMNHRLKLDGTLDSLKKYGYGGVVSNVGFEGYLQNEDEWKRFQECLKACRDLGLDYWLYDEKGYPSGKAGGLTLKDHPEFETSGILCSRTEGKGTITQTMPLGRRYTDEPLLICAAPVEKGLYDFSKMIDLTVQKKPGSNVVTWSAPDSQQWGILSFHLKKMYEGTHIETNVSDTNRYINIIDKEAVARFISVTHEAYKKRAPAEMSGYIHAVFTDEPSLMTSYLKNDPTVLPAIPWSWTFRAGFKAKFGYDIVPSLPFLFEDGGKETVFKRLDYWSFVSQLIEENYYGQIQNWCRANGPAASGHGLLEESLYWHAVYEGNLYRDLRRMDLPGLDMLTSDATALARSTQIPGPKLVSSVTHMTGKVENMSETSAHQQKAVKIPVSFGMRLATVGYEYVLGLTRVTSYYGYDEFTNSERKIFNDYIGRLGLLLTKGKHKADVAVYYPIQTMWGSITPTKKTTWEPPEPMRTESLQDSLVKNKGLYLTTHIIPYNSGLPLAQKVDAAFGEVSLELLAGQLDFDYLDDQAISEAKLKNGEMNIQGESFSCLVLPETRIIPLSTYRKMADFVSGGGHLVVFGELPKLGMNERDTKDVIQISAQLKQSGNVKIVTSIPEIQQAVSGFISPDITLDKPCRELFYNHRTDEKGDIYYLINLTDQSVEREVTFRAIGNIEIWNPINGEIQPAEGILKNRKTILKIRLNSYESRFILFKR
jgi:hypothetical protein